MTVAELAGWSVAVPCWLVLVVALGLGFLLIGAAAFRSAQALQAAAPDKAANRREAIGAASIGLLPMSFLLRNGTVEWIMWRDEPVWAAACAAVALVLGAVWILSRPPPPTGSDL